MVVVLGSLIVPKVFYLTEKKSEFEEEKMQFASPSQAEIFLKKAVDTQKDIYIRNVLSYYGHNMSIGDTNLVQLCKNDKSEVFVDMISRPSSCRGFAMETIFRHPRFSMGPKVKTPQNITCIYAGLSDYMCKVGLALVNNLEYQAGWPLTKAVEVVKNRYVILGSKRWSACLPLYSAYVLLFKAAYINVQTRKRELNETIRVNDFVNLHSYGVIEKMFGALENHLKYTNPVYKGFTGTNPAVGLALCFQNGNLLKLMRHYRHITGPDAYKNITRSGQVHNTGIGDFLLLLKDYDRYVASLRRYRNLNHNETYRAHGKMIERMRKLK